MKETTGGGGGTGGELESLVVFFIGCVVFFMTALCVQDGARIIRLCAVLLSDLLPFFFALPCAGVEGMRERQRERETRKRQTQRR